MRSEIYTDTTGNWRWRLVADSGTAVAGSGEGYANYAECVNGLDEVKSWARAQWAPGPARHVPTDPRSLIGLFDEPTPENLALLDLADRLFRR